MMRALPRCEVGGPPTLTDTPAQTAESAQEVEAAVKGALAEALAHIPKWMLPRYKASGKPATLVVPDAPMPAIPESIELRTDAHHHAWIESRRKGYPLIPGAPDPGMIYMPFRLKELHMLLDAFEATLEPLPPPPPPPPRKRFPFEGKPAPDSGSPF